MENDKTTKKSIPQEDDVKYIIAAILEATRTRQMKWQLVAKEKTQELWRASDKNGIEVQLNKDLTTQTMASPYLLKVKQTGSNDIFEISGQDNMISEHALLKLYTAVKEQCQLSDINL